MSADRVNGWFDPDDVVMRDILLIAASRAKGVDMSRLARAFGISPSMGWYIPRRFQLRGMAGIVERKRGGRGVVICVGIQVTKTAYQGVQGNVSGSENSQHRA